MNYIIRQKRLIDIIEKYLQDSIGRLRVFPIQHVNAREDDFELVNDKGETVFVYLDYSLGVEENLYVKMLSLFNMNHRELEKILQPWFNRKFPKNVVIQVYPIIE